MKTWTINNIENSFEVVGRGLVIVFIPNKNDILFNDGKIPLSVGNVCYYNSNDYVIQSIEVFSKSFYSDSDPIGLNIKLKI